jgi:biopolymer transport protein TolR
MRVRKKRKLKAEINVVPYIDVMLVLLIIFMVTAPLLNLGVDIKLPESTAKALQVPKDPITIGVDKDGKFFLQISGGAREEMNPDDLVKKVAAYVRADPQVPVLLGGDSRATYGQVYQILPGLQAAGVTKLQLMSAPLQSSKP